MIIGKANASAIGTLVECTTGYTLLVHLPNGDKGRTGCSCSHGKDQDSAEVLRKSLTW